jgi:hypothetical protein
MMSNSDLLDEYCDSEFGHTDWKMTFDADGNMVVTFFKEPRSEYLADMEDMEDDEDDEDQVHPSFDPVFKNER